MTFNFTKYSSVYYIVSGILVLAAIVSLFAYGLRFGIEFVGGTNMRVAFANERPSNESMQDALKDFNLGQITVQPTGETDAILTFQGVDEATHQQILVKLNTDFAAEEKSFQYIGPSVGKELRNKTLLATIASLLAITLYIAFAFRKVSRPVASWKYGLASLIALAHDVLIPVGVFTILGRFYNTEITIPIVAALLTVVGFSVHDTIVIFDRIRENILKKGQVEFEGNVNDSLSQTMGRSITTTTTVLIVLFSIFIFGGDTLRDFSLALIIGIVAGAYSSIFIAGPLLVTWYKHGQKKFLNNKSK